jgi:dephospho-CoA kinase
VATILNQRRIGLTGGIATGKSTVSRYLATAYHLPILDADLYAKAAVEPGSPLLGQIVERYGSGILQSDGSLNRPQLGTIVFQDAVERQWLEQNIHPLVRDRLVTESQALSATDVPLLVLAIPLLFEAQMTDLVTEIWVVTCPPEQQLARLIHRDRLSVEDAQARMMSQWPLSQKVSLADQVLNNASSVENLYQQVDIALRQGNLR